MPGSGLAVADAVEMLRSELVQALASAAGQEVQFGLNAVTLTLSVVASAEGGGSVKTRWWVVDAEASGKYAREQVQTIELTLKPYQILPTGERRDMQVGAADVDDGKDPTGS